jgi:hypothetical protein
LIKVREDMVAKTGRERARRREAGNRRWEESNLTKAKTDPTTRVDGVPVKCRSSWSHVEPPRVTTPIQSESREINAACKIGGKIYEEGKA